MLVCTHIPLVDCVSYSHNGLVGHIQLDLLLVDLSLYHQPCEPDNDKREDRQHIYDKSGLFVYLAFLDQFECSFFKYMLSGTVQYCDVESILPCRKIDVDYIVQIVLGNDRPL